MTHRSEFGRVFGTSRPVGKAPVQVGQQLLNLSTLGRATPERVLTLLSSVPALKKIPVATFAPGFGERALRLVTTRAKLGKLVSDDEFLGLIDSVARPGVRR